MSFKFLVSRFAYGVMTIENKRTVVPVSLSLD